MKILWTVNLIPSEASQKLNINSVVLGGWVESMAQRLKNYPEVKLAIACKTDKTNSFDEEILEDEKLSETLSQNAVHINETLNIDKITEESIFKNKQLIKNLSAERVFTEFKKLICGKSYLHFLRMIFAKIKNILHSHMMMDQVNIHMN